MNLAENMMSTARITPISKPNRVSNVMRCNDGGLRVTLHSGRTFKIDKDDEMIQAFIVYTVLADV